jgi:hypothetical protein
MQVANSMSRALLYICKHSAGWELSWNELYLLNLLYSSAPDIPKNAKIFSDLLVESSLMNFRVKQVAFFLIFYVSRILVHVIIGISLIILGNVWYERNMKMKRTRFP